jgi:hypothetical protein
MTSELLLIAVVVGLFGAWLVGIVKGKGAYVVLAQRYRHP